MSRTTLPLLAMISLAVACGGGMDRNDPSSAEAMCGAQPTVSADGKLATSYGCSFENQIHNILKNGLLLSATGAALSDANGPVNATITDSCGQYYLGTDRTGTSFILNRDTGAVVSHGSVHAGYEIANIPATLALPITVEQ